MQSITVKLRKIEQTNFVRAIRTGLVDMIPVLLIGAFALVFMSFPVIGYQEFIKEFADGFLMDLFDTVNFATFGLLSVYTTLFISRAYIRMSPTEISGAGAMISSLLAFFIMAGKDFDSYGPKSMFLALVAGLGATALYKRIFPKVKTRQLLSKGADKHFNLALDSFKAAAIVSLIFATANIIILKAFGISSLRELLIFRLLINKPTFGNGLLFVLLSSFLWFLGIHGSDVLEDTMQQTFAAGIDFNRMAVAAGTEPSHILTKPFFDCFVLMGGCGATICLLAAILIFSKNRSRRELGVVASVPMLFNINELMVFGLPVIYNPVMLVPFILTPVVCYCISYAATYFGLVPVVTGNVEWTTPIILGGYYATGSLAGSFLQLFNLMVGMCIYMPFVRILDRESEEESKRVYDEFVEYFQQTESLSETLKDRKDIYGEFARNLMADLRHDMNIHLFYQPQYNYRNKCVGVEALLRWDHPLFGTLYPPLVVRLAHEGGFLSDLEEAVMTKVLEDMDRIRAKYGNVQISFNITGTTIVNERFIKFCESHAAENLCIEITEQAALAFNDSTINALRRLRTAGFSLAIDDFSMGHTSINYLKNGLFDEIKLDGSLVKELPKNENCREIIKSITSLAETLGMEVVAEYVETAEQKRVLHELGCNCYQGWLYSPAVEL